MRSISVALLLAFTALSAFASSSPTGQLWYVTNAGDVNQSVIAHINNDGGSQTNLISAATFTGLSAATLSEIRLDPAANLYFFMSTNKLGVGSVLYAGHLNSSAAPTAVYTAPTVTPIENSDIVNTFEIDVYTHHLYIGYSDAGAAPANSGIKDFTYDTSTGALTPVATNNGWLVRADQQTAISIFDPSDFALDVATNTLIFVIENANEIYRLNLSTPTTITPLVQQSQFPIDHSNGFLHSVVVDSSTGTVYFYTHSAHASPDATYSAALNNIYAISEMASGSTAAMAITLSGLPVGNHFYPTSLTFDPAGRSIYVVDEELDTGTDPDNDDVIDVLQLDGPGTTGSLITTIQTSPNFTSGTANNYTSMAFDVFPTLSAPSGTLTHAGEQGAAITLLTAAPAMTDVDGDHLASATVQITGGTFASNETSTADDHLSVPAAALSGTNITPSYDSGTETLTLSGYDTFAHYSSVLAAVQYNTTGDNPTNYGLNTTRTIQWIVSDGAPNVPFGAQNSGSTTITIDAVNDPPINTVPGAQTALEDTNMPISGVSVSDVDANPGVDGITTTLLVTHGTLTVTPAGGATVMNNSTGSVTISGTTDAIDGTLTSLVYRGNQDYNGPDTLTIVTSDLGHTGTGGALTDSDTVNISVTPVNDPPQGTNNTKTILEDQPYAFASADFGFSDPYDTPPNALLAVKVATLPAPGVLTDNNVAVTAGQFIPVADITGGKLVFTPAPNGNGNAYATFNFQLQDDGGTANGGVDLSTANTMTINVAGINDPPFGANHTLTVTENTSYSFAAADFGFTDPNDMPPNNLLAVKITTPPAAGTLTDNSMAVTAGQFIPVADIAGGKLRFTPAMNATGAPYAMFTFQVQDDGGTANGGIDIDATPKTMAVNVNAVLPPSITKSFGAPFAVLAQTWPLPARTQNTEVPCNPCPGNSRTDLVTVGYSSPITTYTGRFLDSQSVGTFQQPFRTARAETVTIAPQLNRIYMMIGSAVVAYDINTFFNRLNSRETLTSATSIPVTPNVAAIRAAPYELFLQWDKFFYAENGSPWQTILLDGQQRLFQIDYDDQGYVYLAYSAFGWGIVKDSGTGGSLMQSMYQAFNSKTAQIATFKSSTGRYYAMIGGGLIYDTTDRTHPLFVRTAGSFHAVAKDSTSTRLAIVNATGGLDIWRTDDFIAGGAPLATFSSGTTNGYSLVTSDGTNFYADAYNSSAVIIGTIRYDGVTYTQTLYPTPVNIGPQPTFASGFQYSAGFITIAGISAAGYWDVALLKMTNGVPSVVDLHSYVAHYYSVAPDANHITPSYTNLDDAVVYQSGSHYYLILEAGGLGDVYEIDGAGILTASNPARTLSASRVIHPDSAPTMPLFATTSLSFTITNPNATLALTGVAFTDPLPAGLSVATPNGLSGTCGAGTIATTAGSITLSGGTIPANSNCSFSVNVIATAPGTKNNTTGNISSTEAGTGGVAVASIDVVAPPSIAKNFGAATISLNGTTSLTFTITNPAANSEVLTGVSFTDNFPAGMQIASPNGFTGSCGGGTITATAGATSVSLSNGIIAVAGNCSFSLNVLATGLGNQVNTTGNVTATNGGSGNTATASLQVVAPDLAIAKTHTGNFTQGDTGKTYTITVWNAGTASTNGTVTVVDTLPSGLTASAISGTGWMCTLATLTCTRSDVLASTANYPQITVTVNVSSNAAMSVTNTATVSGGGEVDTGNDSASDPTAINPSGLGGPTNLVATAISATQVTVTWNALPSAVKYQLYRSDHHGSFQPLGLPVMATTVGDSFVAPNTTYVYMVVAIDGSNNIIAASNIDIATTTIFTDDPVVALSTAIKAVHVTELRTAVNAVAAAAGMSPFTFTDSSLSGVLVKAGHIAELRSVLNAARSAIGVPVIAFTDPGLGAGTVAKAVHVQDLRSGVK